MALPAAEVASEPPVGGPPSVAPREAAKEAREEAAATQVTARSIAPTAQQYGALFMMVLSVIGIVAGTLALGFSPGVLVPGTALVLAPTAREGFSWSAAAFQGSLEVQAYAATALRDNSIATAVLIVAGGYFSAYHHTYRGYPNM